MLEGDAVNASLSFAASVPFVGWTATGAKYAGILVAVAGKSYDLVMTVKNGIITFGNRSQLRKVLDITDSNIEAHHLIPWKHSDNELVQRAAGSNSTPFHMNHPDNGLPVEKFRTNTNPNGQHANHPKYNDYVEDRMEREWQDLIDAYGGEANISPEVARGKLEEIIDELRTDILNNPNKKINELYP